MATDSKSHRGKSSPGLSRGRRAPRMVTLSGQPIPIGGSATLSGPQGGRLTMRSNSDFSYTPPAPREKSFIEVFSYKYISAGGERRTAKLSFIVDPDGSVTTLRPFKVG